MNTAPLNASPASNAARAELHKQAVAFEGLFLNLLMRSMRNASPENARFHGGRGETIFRGMQDQEYADRMAGQFGISDMIEKSLGGRLDLRG